MKKYIYLKLAKKLQYKNPFPKVPKNISKNTKTVYKSLKNSSKHLCKSAEISQIFDALITDFNNFLGTLLFLYFCSF